MSKAPPPIPPEQRVVDGPGPQVDKADEADVRGESGDKRDLRTDVRTGQKGDSDLNREQQGRFGDIWQNTHNQGYQQDR
jgi:hypothetical protein